MLNVVSFSNLQFEIDYYYYFFFLYKYVLGELIFVKEICDFCEIGRPSRLFLTSLYSQPPVQPQYAFVSFLFLK